jgi:hypothetical protein
MPWFGAMQLSEFPKLIVRIGAGKGMSENLTT